MGIKKNVLFLTYYQVGIFFNKKIFSVFAFSFYKTVFKYFF